MMLRQGYRGRQGFTLGTLGFLIIANLIIFFITSIRPEIKQALALSGNGLLSQPWTIVTSMFTHANFSHIFSNMLTLYFYGSFLIGAVGEKKFLTIYLLGGLLGNIFFLLLSPPYIAVIGASGAVFAIGGTLVALNPRLPVILFPIPIPIPLWVVIIGGFLIISPLVAWQAHLGGLILGLGVGYAYRRNRGLRI